MMLTRPALVLRLLAILVASVASAYATEPFLPASGAAPAGVLGEGTQWATPWYVVEGAEPGPTVLLTAGLHGNEPAGHHAAEQIRHWPIARGRLIVVPAVNRVGLAADTRWFPPERNNRSQRDLNRGFPRSAEDTPENPLCAALWQFVRQHEPSLVIDLHEGFDFHAVNKKSVGSSVICSPSPDRLEQAVQMLAAANELAPDEQRQFVLLASSGAVKGSLVRACNDVLGIDAFILETTFKDQPVSLRARQHRAMVSTLLQDVGVVDRDCVDLLVPDDGARLLTVGLFDGDGASANGLRNLSRVIAGEDDMLLSRIGPHDMHDDVLARFDVLVFPGGSGSKQGRAIGDDGRAAVRRFVKSGGGLIGVCAGAYLCSSHYGWSLHVLNMSVFNKTLNVPGVGRKSMWYRGGPKDVTVQFADEAADVLDHDGTVSIRYQNGPIVSPGTSDSAADYTPLAWFRSEVVRYEPQRGTMLGAPAIVSAEFGEGRVIAISPHPEATPGLEPVLSQAIRWVARQ